ncbi:MAG: DUF1178 family protein [Rhizobiales bacterium]|nr:DUF1178 family protein [Hyphomicrobiales bacterium]
MIRYDLKCAQGHGFDGWFSDSASFDKQADAGIVECPVCGTCDVQKALMAPGIPAKSNKKPEAQPVMQNAAGTPAAELTQMIRKLRKHVEENSEYVGPRFAEEARKIHYEESEARGIYGEASLEEARELNEEGIDVQPLPLLPEEHN